MGEIKRIYTLFNILISNLIPKFITVKLDAEIFSILKFVKFASHKVQKSEKILDAGAGTGPYKKYFLHADYDSTDISEYFDKRGRKIHSFTCNLNKIPKKDNFYDAIICTQVLEHVKEPQKVIKEFYRVLRSGGKLFLTAPQSDGLHCEPNHYFNFTKYSLEMIFLKAGFSIKFIKPRGGIFWYLGKRIRSAPLYILKQHINLGLNPILILMLPLYSIILPICCFLIPFLFFYLDNLDKKKNYTLGYACYCVKSK